MAETDPRLIRLIARHFNDMQGLRHAVASMVYVAFGRPAYPDPSAFAWMAPRMWTFSAALIIAGVADHLLLLRILPGAGSTAAEHAS